MTGSVIRYIYFTTIVTFCSLYAAQPIQPYFQTEFRLTDFQAILFTTLMMAPLGCAPFVYGYFLELFSARLMVRWALFFLGLLEILFAMADSYSSLLIIRCMQGLIIPAILTSLMSYISYTSTKDKVQHSIAAYIAATILGGFLGRFLSGLFTDLFGWRFFFVLLGLLLFLNCYLLKEMVKDIKMEYSRPKFQEIFGLFRQREFLLLYFSIFCLFFVFAALMNFLPFELKRINPTVGESGIGVLYLGYSMGIVVSLNSRKIIQRFNNELDAIGVGIALFFAGVLFFMVKSYPVMFAGMFVFCAGFFTAHSLLSGFVNKIARDNKAMANGLYICFYYTGGTLGSLLPGAVIYRYGWQVFVSQLILMIGLAYVLTRYLKHATVDC